MEATMAKKEEKSLIAQRISWLIWGFLAALVILLVSAFSTAWRTNQALKAELATLQPIVAAAQAEQETLKERLDYVKSEQYVAEWSRMRAGMTHSGETLVISIAVTPTATPVPIGPPAATPTPTRVAFWTRWWQALSGD